MAATMTSPHKKLTAIITGASSGIGAETAKILAEDGYDLLLLGRDHHRLENIRKECSKYTSVETLAFDLKTLSHHQTQIDAALAKLSPAYALINNAGIFKYGTLLTTSDQDWLEFFQVNLLSAVELTKMIWPYFQKRKSGVVVNISSTLSLKPTAGTGAYSALKAALNNWTLSLAQEGGAYGIRANCICPGIVDTPIHSFHGLQNEAKNKIEMQIASQQLLSQIGRPADIAHAIRFLVNSDSAWTTGAVLTVDGGINIK